MLRLKPAEEISGSLLDVCDMGVITPDQLLAQGGQGCAPGPRAAAGVPLVLSNGTALALKSGNFGGPDFFAETLALMETVQ